MLIQVCGLPGTGKSTLAARLADRRPVVLLRIDAIEAAMWRNGLTPDQTGIAAYSVAHLVALPHLERGQTVVADAVSAVGAARQGWRGTAEYTGVPLRVIETVCPDRTEHCRRVTTRTSDLPGFPLPTWEQVQAMASQYETRHDERLVLDTRRDLDSCVQDVMDYVDRT
ncbi:MAG TPA: ATP-binding protein [Nocardioidaceae bacterium]|nr:ATP-binding protein [Nocardioidaceae bacterium]